MILKPCPFCGSKVKITRTVVGGFGYNNLAVSITCDKCKIPTLVVNCGYDYNAEERICNKWNNRKNN